MFTTPGKSGSEDQEERAEEDTVVDVDPMPNSHDRTKCQSEARRDEPDLAEETKKSGARENEEGPGMVRPTSADHVIGVVVVTDSSSLISVRESKSVD